MSNFGMIRKAIYQLKREWPTEIRILRETSDVDVVSGIKEVTEAFNITIRKAVVLPSQMVRDFVYDLAFVAANKNFSYGGFFDTNTRVIAIDAGDLRGNKIQLQDIVIIQNRRSVCENIGYFEGSQGEPLAYLIAIKDTRGVADV